MFTASKQNTCASASCWNWCSLATKKTCGPNRLGMCLPTLGNGGALCDITKGSFPKPTIYSLESGASKESKKIWLFFFVHWPASGRYWGQKTLAGEFCIIYDAECKTWPSHGMWCANPSPLECGACCLPSGSRKTSFSSAQIDANLLRKTCATWCHATDALRATWSEGCRANLIWVKRGAQSLPISSDLINPNRVIVPDDKEVPLCADLIVRSLFHCLGGPARSSAEKEQLSIFTTAGHKGLTLMLIESGRATGTCVGH